MNQEGCVVLQCPKTVTTVVSYGVFPVPNSPPWSERNIGKSANSLSNILAHPLSLVSDRPESPPSFSFLNGAYSSLRTRVPHLPSNSPRAGQLILESAGKLCREHIHPDIFLKHVWSGDNQSSRTGYLVEGGNYLEQSLKHVSLISSSDQIVASPTSSGRQTGGGLPLKPDVSDVGGSGRSRDLRSQQHMIYKTGRIFLAEFTQHT
ncbi:hypothetical protein J6590_070973 [Homalodisca vitripennis]|nr:hypothetical protein J6590_070973 [Homalodisca vitripennis]